MGVQPVSCVLPTFDRAPELERTLIRIFELPDRPAEIVVVDNASRDGTEHMVRREFPGVLYRRLETNAGAAARNVGASLASQPWLLMLDSDSWPTPGSVARMVRILEGDSRLGALGFRVRLLDGGDEPGGTHCVFVGCGVGIRRDLFLELGGYSPDYHFYVEEYDLSFRMLERGLDVRMYGDIVVEHAKSTSGRDTGEILARLVRNNLLLWWRFLPARLALAESVETLRRYRGFARGFGGPGSLARGLGLAPGAIRRALATRVRLSGETMERIFQDRFLSERMREIAGRGIRRIAFLSMGKLYPRFVTAARGAGLDVRALYESRLADSTTRHRGVAVRTEAELVETDTELVVIGSSCPGGIARARQVALARGCPAPVEGFYDYSWSEATAAVSERVPVQAAETPSVPSSRGRPG